MTNEQIFSHIDHTLLNMTATKEEIFTLCDEAVLHKTASVCIPPSFVELVRSRYADLNICTVIGFPLGYNKAEVKEQELLEAKKDGADEFDVVINVGHVKNKSFDQVKDELSTLRSAAGDKILKVIIETCYLTDDEKIALCDIVSQVKADFIKTSTGFGTAGGQLEDIALFKKYLAPGVKIKASGGIRTRKAMEDFINAGSHRIGSSSAVKALLG